MVNVNISSESLQEILESMPTEVLADELMRRADVDYWVIDEGDTVTCARASSGPDVTWSDGPCVVIRVLTTL